MEKFVQLLKKKVEDETAAFAILWAMMITFTLTILVCGYVEKNKVAQVNANVSLSQTEEDIKNPNEFQTLTEVTSQEALKELTEKEKEDKKETNKENENYSPKYYIKVNYGAQVVNIYKKDSEGNYTVPVKAMVCSTGTHTPTSGVYTIGYRWEWLEMIGSVYGHYVTQIYGDILFHSVPYLERGNHSSLEWWAYDQLGTKASLGCVRLTTIDALWIYNNIGSGTKVEFYSSSNPGPLGKPSARKISNAPSNIKGWDPTDPDSRNPWPEYLEELENKKEEDKKDDNKKPDKNEENTNNTTVDKNEIINDVVNDISNDIINNTTNDIINDTGGEEVNNIEQQANNIEDNVYVNEILNC